MNPVNENYPKTRVYFIVYNGDPSGDEVSIGSIDPNQVMSSGYDNKEIYDNEEEFIQRCNEIGQTWPIPEEES